MHDPHSLNLLFALFVVVGFLAWFAATWPVKYAERAARGCFFIAALIWAFQQFGSH